MPEECVGVTRTQGSYSYEQLYGCWELSPGSINQQVCLATQLSLQLHRLNLFFFLFFYKFFCHVLYSNPIPLSSLLPTLNLPLSPDALFRFSSENGRHPSDINQVWYIMLQ